MDGTIATRQLSGNAGKCWGRQTNRWILGDDHAMKSKHLAGNAGERWRRPTKNQKVDAGDGWYNCNQAIVRERGKMLETAHHKVASGRRPCNENQAFGCKRMEMEMAHQKVDSGNGWYNQEIVWKRGKMLETAHQKVILGHDHAMKTQHLVGNARNHGDCAPKGGSGS